MIKPTNVLDNLHMLSKVSPHKGGQHLFGSLLEQVMILL